MNPTDFRNLPFAVDGGEDRRPWEEDRHHPLLGRNLPVYLVPNWPATEVIPGFAKDKTLPTHFKAYTRHYDGTVYSDMGHTYEEARWNLTQVMSNHE
ncbi:MAG: hypothetical protein ACRDUW_06540 [Pseudonocardiaceae bacterium]